MKQIACFILFFAFLALPARPSLVRSKSRLDFWPGPIDTAVDVSVYHTYTGFAGGKKDCFSLHEKRGEDHARVYIPVLFSLVFSVFSYYAGYVRGNQKK